MAAIKGKNTTPELNVRRLLHKMGYRFRLHVKDLPGKPDIVLPRLRTIIEVRGCFWHRHPECKYSTTPSTRPDFWLQKFEDTVARDLKNDEQLRQAGWKVIVIWECATRDTIELQNVINRELP